VREKTQRARSRVDQKRDKEREKKKIRKVKAPKMIYVTMGAPKIDTAAPQ